MDAASAKSPALTLLGVELLGAREHALEGLVEVGALALLELHEAQLEPFDRFRS
jgi:hypothetical protein